MRRPPRRPRSRSSPHSPECGPVEATVKHLLALIDDGPLRTLRSAAPLKRGPRMDQLPSPNPSPHSPECGPVEARSHLRTMHRRLFSPHSPECGPVEATTRGPRISGCVPLRTLRSAAPLKRSRWYYICPLLGALRTLRSAAPLKRSIALPSKLSRLASPHSPECGPVEAPSLRR